MVKNSSTSSWSASRNANARLGSMRAIGMICADWQWQLACDRHIDGGCARMRGLHLSMYAQLYPAAAIPSTVPPTGGCTAEGQKSDLQELDCPHTPQTLRPNESATSVGEPQTYVGVCRRGLGPPQQGLLCRVRVEIDGCRVCDSQSGNEGTTKSERRNDSSEQGRCEAHAQQQTDKRKGEWQKGRRVYVLSDLLCLRIPRYPKK